MTPHPKVTSDYKALTRETTVYKTYVELKEGSLTSKGYLDLVKVPDLFIKEAGYFLKKLREMNQCYQRDIAKSVNCSLSLVCQWESNSRNIKLETLVKIAESFGISRDTIYELIDQGRISLKNNLPLKIETIWELIPYLVPCKTDVGKVIILHCPETMQHRIRDVLKAKLCKSRTNFVINSRDLHRYINTFFQRTKEIKLQFPLTHEVKAWYEEGIDLVKAVIIPLLQTDGSCSNNQPAFYGTNKAFHNLFVDSMYYAFNILPTCYLYTDMRGLLHTRYGYNKKVREIVSKIMNICGNTKTSPANRQAPEQYLKETQPRLDYLLNCSKSEQEIALRIWASTEGYVCLNLPTSYIGSVFGIGCTHPILVDQLQQLAERLNINFRKHKSKITWSGIGGLETASQKASLNFLKIGNFIENVKIGKHSKHHVGIPKDKLLLGIFEYKKRQQNKYSTKNSSIRLLKSVKSKRANARREINEIINKGEYQTAEYYINWFAEKI